MVSRDNTNERDKVINKIIIRDEVTQHLYAHEYTRHDNISLNHIFIPPWVQLSSMINPRNSTSLNSVHLYDNIILNKTNLLYFLNTVIIKHARQI